jgi:hypothetical protein
MVMNLPTVLAEEVERFYRQAFRRFFLRPRYIARRPGRIRSPSDLRQALLALRAVAGV